MTDEERNQSEQTPLHAVANEVASHSDHEQHELDPSRNRMCGLAVEQPVDCPFDKVHFTSFHKDEKAHTGMVQDWGITRDDDYP